MDVSRYPRPGVLAGVLFVAGLVFLFGFVHALKSSGFTDVREGCMAPAIPAKEAASMGGATALDPTSLRGCDPSAYLVKSPPSCVAQTSSTCGTVVAATPAAPRPTGVTTTTP